MACGIASWGATSARASACSKRGVCSFWHAQKGYGFLTLAQTAEGVSCFLVPRWLPDGTRNAGFTVQRLKEKLGDWANASSEVEYNNAWGLMVGSPGRGVRTIVEMVVHTRLDCTIGSSALMRLAAQHGLAARATAYMAALTRVVAQRRGGAAGTP